MPRQLRVEFPGAFYHVMARGNRRQAIYRDDRDREVFMAGVEEVCGRCGWRIHAYTLMGNHYHLLVETPEANLVRGMGWLQTAYTARFNARHRLRGHLFGERYKAVVVQRDEGNYFPCLIDYIHLNPYRAGLVGLEKGLERYPWTSLAHYLSTRRKRPKWQVVEEGLAVRGLRDTAKGRRKFLEELEARAQEEGRKRAGKVDIEGQSLNSSLQRGWYFGNQAFREQMLSLLEGRVEKVQSNPNYGGEQARDYGERRAEEIVKRGLKVLGMKEGDLATTAKSDERKVLIALVVRRESTAGLRWIASRLQMGVITGLSRYTGEMKGKVEGQRKWRRLYQMILK